MYRDLGWNRVPQQLDASSSEASGEALRSMWGTSKRKEKRLRLG